MRKKFHTRSASNLTREMHNGLITFLYLAFSHVFRIHHKNGFEPILPKTVCFRQRNQSPHKRAQYRSEGSLKMNVYIYTSARSTPPGQVELWGLKDTTDLNDVCTSGLREPRRLAGSLYRHSGRLGRARPLRPCVDIDEIVNYANK